MYVCVPPEYLVPREGRSRFEFPGAGVTVSHPVGAGGWTQALWKSVLLLAAELPLQSSISFFFFQEWKNHMITEIVKHVNM